MTICIAALCEKGEKIIVAADRMVTVGQIIEFEHDVPKFVNLTDNCVVMTAGSTTLQNDIIKEASSKIKTLKKPNFKQITDELKNAYATLRIKRAEETILLPKNLNFQTFYQSQRIMLPELVFQMTDAINKTNLGVEYILCGFDENGGHIHYIVDPGISECWDSVGFCSIGTGNLNSVSAFTAHNYAPNFPIEKSLYLVYLAKKEAQRAPGVGNDTDIAILTKEGIKSLNDEEKKSLDLIHKKFMKIEDEEYREVKRNMLDGWQNATNNN